MRFDARSVHFSNRFSSHSPRNAGRYVPGFRSRAFLLFPRRVLRSQMWQRAVVHFHRQRRLARAGSMSLVRRASPFGLGGRRQSHTRRGEAWDLAGPLPPPPQAPPFPVQMWPSSRLPQLRRMLRRSARDEVCGSDPNSNHRPVSVSMSLLPSGLFSRSFLDSTDK